MNTQQDNNQERLALLDALHRGELPISDALALHETFEQHRSPADPARDKLLPENLRQRLHAISDTTQPPIGHFDDLCLREMDHLTTPQEELAIRDTIAQYPPYAVKRARTRLTRLQPNVGVAYPAKERLKRAEKPIMLPWLRATAVAATIALLLSIAYFRPAYHTLASPHPIAEVNIQAQQTIAPAPETPFLEQATDYTPSSQAVSNPVPKRIQPQAKRQTATQQTRPEPLAPLKPVPIAGLNGANIAQTAQLAMVSIPPTERIDWELLEMQEALAAMADLQEEELDELEEPPIVTRAKQVLRLLAVRNGY